MSIKKQRKQSDSSEEHQSEINQIEQSCQINKKVRIMPKKRDFRMHAHCNPLVETYFPYPLNPSYVDWSINYPQKYGKSQDEYSKIKLNTLEYPITYLDQINDTMNGKIINPVDYLDIGCGFGGLIFALAENFPDQYVMGMEIRGKVVNFVGEKIRAIRIESQYQKCMNASVVRTNTMKHLVQYFRKESLQKIFICFPDPQFKKRNHRRRIVNTGLISEYAYVLKPKGRLYCITDVQDLHQWHVEYLSKHKMFRQLTEEDIQSDKCAQLIWSSTEEGQKVERNKGNKFIIVCEKI